MLVTGCVIFSSDVAHSGPDILMWTIAAAVVGLAAIQTSAGPQLGMDMPVLLASGFVLGPLPAGIIAFAGYVDLREFRGEIALERAVFNRAQTSLCVMAAAGGFSLVGGPSNAWPRVVLAALVAVGIDCAMNYLLVGGVMALHERVPPRVSLARLRLGSLLAFVATYASFGLLSLLLAEVHGTIGAWSLLLFAAAVVLARQAFWASERLSGAEHRLRVQGLALKEVSDRVVDERRDERLALASGLHDDLLPSIFQVHLLGQVLRQELATGQLLEMEDDLPALVHATDEASRLVRDMIRGLRSSRLGMQGLARTLRLLLHRLEAESAIDLRADIEDVRATPVVELLAYQVAHEALRNALRHSGASSVAVLLVREGDSLRLIVRDDGRGFDPHLTDESRHFGIALMRERVELAGGLMQIVSSRDAGTDIVVRLPLTDPIRA